MLNGSRCLYVSMFIVVIAVVASCFSTNDSPISFILKMCNPIDETAVSRIQQKFSTILHIVGRVCCCYCGYCYTLVKRHTTDVDVCYYDYYSYCHCHCCYYWHYYCCWCFYNVFSIFIHLRIWQPCNRNPFVAHAICL